MARLLADAATLAVTEVPAEEAMQWAVDLVCAHTGWPLGHVMVVDPELDLLVSTRIWHNEDPDTYREFAQLSETMQVRRGEGLPGRSLAAGAPVWLPDQRPQEAFSRRAAGIACGLRAGFAFPITSERGAEGVIEIFASQRVEPDEDLLALAAHVGVQVGRVFDRDRARRQLREAERLAQLGPWSWDLPSDVMQCSTELYLMHGIEPRKGPDGEYIADPVSRKAWLAILHPEDRGAMQEFSERVISTGESDEFDYRVKRGRAVRWLRTYAEVAERRDGQVTRIAGYTQDITVHKRLDARRRRVQRELANQQRTLERIARGEPLADTLTDLCRHVERQLPSAHCSILIFDRAGGVLLDGAAPTLPPGFRAAIDGLPVADGMGACGSAAARGEVVVVSDTLTDPLTASFTDLAKQFHLGSVWSHPLRKAGGEVLGTFAVYRAAKHKPSRAEVHLVATTGSLAALAIERHRSEAALQTAANVDALTGLLNRARFLELVNEQLHLPDRAVAVMFLEIDRWGHISDSLGHLAGERIILEVADRLRQVLGPEALVARFGGDVFTAMVPGAQARSIERLADRALRAIEKPIGLDGGEFFLTASAGIAQNGQDTDAYGLVRDADAAMNAARAKGRGHRQVFDRRLRARTIERLNHETELRHAIERGELVMHYQPILDLSARKWSGVEALVRWDHPERGMIGPDDFIPLAEETGLIIPLGTSVLEMVAAQAARWSVTLPEIHIAANASALQLADPMIASDLIALLDGAGLRPDALRLEVTESALMEEIEATRSALEQLMASGVRILIDDFGTGYSSIARLGELPITGLKIDRRFTSGLGVDSGVRPVLHAIAELARAYDLLMVAEGIEDAVALADVDSLGCQFAQGFHLGRPAPADVIERLLAGPPPGGLRTRPGAARLH